MRWTLLPPVFWLTAFLIVWASPSNADSERVALVIGNAAYANTSALRNPRNDAQDVAAALEKLGYSVISGFDLSHAEMGRTIRRFAAALDGAGIGVFFYAGHGIQIDGVNYLVPTDSRLEDEYSPTFELIPVHVVQRIMENRNRTNILFLDACRDNPLVRNLSRAMGTRSVSIGRGLAASESGIGTLISYSTQPGNVALDGDGRNSPYAGALARHLSHAGLHIGDMLINVRRDVMQATNNKQVPWEHTALTDRFYFSPPLLPRAAEPSSSSPTPAAAVAPKPAPLDKAALTSRLHRELKRVGCDPGTTGEGWTKEIQSALQRFASITKQAIYTDEPTQEALDAVATRKLLVCSPPPSAEPQRAREQEAAQPPPKSAASKRENCRLETWAECLSRTQAFPGARGLACGSSDGRLKICQ